MPHEKLKRKKKEKVKKKKKFQNDNIHRQSGVILENPKFLKNFC